MACLDELRTGVQAQQLMAHESVVTHGRKHFACAGNTCMNACFAEQA